MTTRLLPVEGTYNFRDLGGYEADGGATRTGVFFRSDALHGLSDRGRQQVTDLRVHRVIDLRDDDEQRLAPDALPAASALIPHPIFPSAREHIRRRLGVVEVTELLYSRYASTITAAVALLAEEEPAGEGEAFGIASATVFHCTAGKDRTGAVAALTLLAVGVSREDVVADYAESERHLAGAWLDGYLETLRGRGREITDDLRQLVGTTPVAAIEAALAGIEREYGSARDYLLANGMDEATLERLNVRLVG
ncbi:tyrosine-protein phosphatase [Leucobacter sp. CSA1]|uniref:Tyrosine-protein phosphatase n=1 Tax=Leucobacter chromiisoli TaxID=2796471 RepID=A0A934Q750_9MICO|nr:tyrosine-protein phosphatase [Leucobacter chromiisoli]MBK0418928.1 tyrosine-protein phosphatase [Leucobacter chromiisoli]